MGRPWTLDAMVLYGQLMPDGRTQVQRAPSVSSSALQARSRVVPDRARESSRRGWLQDYDYYGRDTPRPVPPALFASAPASARGEAPSRADAGAHLGAAPGALQAKLEVAAVDDPRERDADNPADRVLRMQDAPPGGAARDPSGAAAGAGNAPLRRKCASRQGDEDEKVFRKAEGGRRPSGERGPRRRGRRRRR